MSTPVVLFARLPLLEDCSGDASIQIDYIELSA